MVDGIDGSGKSTILAAWQSHLESLGKKVFSLKQYWKEHHTHPTAVELEPNDAIFSAEPTTVWIGAAIREEMIQNGSNYSSQAIATAFSHDRLVLYNRVLLPLLQSGKIIIQDRGVSTSLCYQPIQDPSLDMDYIASLEGNAFALKHAPDHLIIVDVTVEEAMARVGTRHEKKDNSFFEKNTFLESVRHTYLDPSYQQRFTEHGTKIHILKSAGTIDTMNTAAIALLQTLLK